MKYLKVQNLESDSQVKIVSLNRPDVKNAFHPDMIAEITTTFKNFNQDEKIKAVILKGEGSVFCAGADLNWMKEMAQYTLEENKLDSAKMWEMFESVRLCQAPLIGIAHGAVYGGALGLLACCDHVIAEEKTKFCFSEVKLGLAPAVISGFILRKIPDAFVRPYMLSADVFDSTVAVNMGLVHQIYQTTMTVDEVIQPFLKNGVEAMRITKKLLNSILDGISWAEQKSLSTQVISERRMSAEGQEKLKKFLS